MKIHRVLGLVAVISGATVSSAPAGPAGDPLFLIVGPGASQRRGEQLPWSPLARGTQPQPGAEVRCRAGCASSLLGGGTMTAAPDATLVALRPGYFQPPWLEANLQIARVGLREGALRVALGRTTRASLVVEAPGLTVLSRSGRVDVVARAGGAAVAALDDGVWIRTEARWTPLAVGQVVVIRAGEAPSSHPRVTPPQWATVSNGRAPVELALSGEPVPVGARWMAVGGADRYRFQVARDASFADVLQTGLTPPGQTAFDSAPLPPGAYFARVFAVDAEGLESAPTAPLGLRITRAAVPPGAFVDAANRLVILAGTAGIRLLEPEGLEAAVDGRVFLPPPAEIGLDGKDMRFIWLRLGADHAAEASLLLKRRVLRADIAFTPRLPTWPRDPLTIEVDIVDPAGRLDTAAIKPDLHVVLGAEELPVTWVQRAARWTGRVPPRSLPANAVIRVTAGDDLGAPLGLGFVEIAAEARPATASR
jgi:hypothetical protein